MQETTKYAHIAHAVDGVADCERCAELHAEVQRRRAQVTEGWVGPILTVTFEATSAQALIAAIDSYRARIVRSLEGWRQTPDGGFTYDRLEAQYYEEKTNEVDPPMDSGSNPQGEVEG